MTRAPISCSILSSLSRSPSSILSTGMPVQRLTTLAMSCAVTSSRNMALPAAPSASSSCFSKPGMVPYCSSPALARSPERWACSSSIRAPSSSSLILASAEILSFSACQRWVSSSDCCSKLANSLSKLAKRSLDAVSLSLPSASRSIFNWMIRRSSVSISSGFDSTSIRNRDAASSIRSMALSGRKRSEI